jgi:hypothetical protein
LNWLPIDLILTPSRRRCASHFSFCLAAFWSVGWTSRAGRQLAFWIWFCQIS